jgi:hypothetical protein
VSGEVRIAVAVMAGTAVTALAGCGGTNSAIALKVTVTRFVPTKSHSSFTLGCEPVSGTLPFAARICRDIARHRQAMLAPRPSRSTCAGGPLMPTVDVEVGRGASGGGFSGSPNCGWPGGTPLAIYYAAAVRDTHALRLLEPRLRCEDDPAFFAMPTPWASVVSCTRGLWTPLAERAIRAAKQTRVLGTVTHSFPDDPGVVRCQIRAGGSRVVGGLCGVTLSGPASKKLVHFTETWNLGGRILRHHWTIAGKTLIGQSGPPPPQAAI